MADDGKLTERLAAQGFKRLSVLQDFAEVTVKEAQFFHYFLSLKYPFARSDIVLYVLISVGVALGIATSTDAAWSVNALIFWAVVTFYGLVRYLWYRYSFRFVTNRIPKKNLRLSFDLNKGVELIPSTADQVQRLDQVSRWLSLQVLVRLKDGRTVLVVSSPVESMPLMLQDLKS